jgi:hypothetical protein
VRDIEQVLDDRQWIGAVAIKLPQALECARRIAFHQRGEQFEHVCAIGETEQGAGLRLLHRALDMRQRAIEQRQPVAHRAVGGARDQCRRCGVQGAPFLLGDALQVFGESRLIDTA